MPWLLVASIVGFVATVALTLRPPKARRRARRGDWIAFGLVVAVLWGVALVANAQAAARASTARALASMPSVPVEMALADPRYQERPLALTGVAACQAPIADAPGALAARQRYSGQDEVEHDEGPDTIEVVDYGADHEVAPFRLGALSIDASFTVLPREAGTTTSRSSGEYSPALGAELAEYTTVQAIPCGEEVTATGVVSKDATGAATFVPLPGALALLTDRPWESVVAEAQRHARSSGFWGALWAGLAALATAVGAAVGAFVRP